MGRLPIVSCLRSESSYVHSCDDSCHAGVVTHPPRLPLARWGCCWGAPRSFSSCYCSRSLQPTKSLLTSSHLITTPLRGVVMRWDDVNELWESRERHSELCPAHRPRPITRLYSPHISAGHASLVADPELGPLDVEGCNERFLLHGTQPGFILPILTSGLNERLTSVHGLFGSGIFYLAEDCEKSDQ